MFTKFRETWSIRQTFNWFRDNDVELPVHKSRGGRNAVIFQTPRQCFVGSVLHNPFYAGAYAWGRRPTEVVWRVGRAAQAPEIRGGARAGAHLHPRAP